MLVVKVPGIVVDLCRPISLLLKVSIWRGTMRRRGYKTVMLGKLTICLHKLVLPHDQAERVLDLFEVVPLRREQLDVLLG